MRDVHAIRPGRNREGLPRRAASFDARFSQSPSTVRRFRRIEAPQLAIARGGRRVLEIGCGTGRLLTAVDAESRVGIDVTYGLLVQAVPRGLLVAQADAHRLPFTDGVFDAVLAGNAVFRYLDYDRAFVECARVLRPGGRLAVHQYGARVSLPTSISARHLHRLSDLREPASAAGLVELACYVWRSLPWYPYLLRIPEVLPSGMWQHATLVFRKP